MTALVARADLGSLLVGRMQRSTEDQAAAIAKAFVDERISVVRTARDDLGNLIDSAERQLPSTITGLARMRRSIRLVRWLPAFLGDQWVLRAGERAADQLDDLMRELAVQIGALGGLAEASTAEAISTATADLTHFPASDGPGGDALANGALMLEQNVELLRSQLNLVELLGTTQRTTAEQLQAAARALRSTAESVKARRDGRELATHLKGASRKTKLLQVEMAMRRTVDHLQSSLHTLKGNRQS